MPNTISYNLQRLQTARSNIATAITNKGGTVGTDDGFEEFVNDINSIPTGGGSSFALDNVKCKPSLKGELKDFPVWFTSDITSENLSSGYTTLLIYGNSIWTDGNNIYSSYTSSGTTPIKVEYNESLNMWITRPVDNWNVGILGIFIWTDGDNTYFTRYYSGSYNENYVLDKITNKWISKTWNFSGASQPTSWNGSNIWTDGADIYLSTPSGSFILDKSTSTWISKSWNMNIAYGSCVWTDGENIYYSYEDYQYVLNKTTMQWETKQWSYTFTYRAFHGDFVWTDGDNIYLNGSYQSSSGSLYFVSAILDKNTNTWSEKNWGTPSSFYGSDVWNYNGNTYLMNGSQFYILDKDTGTFKIASFRLSNNTNTLSGSYIWYDGDNIYFSYNDKQQIFDKENRIFLNTSFSGLSSFTGNNVWSDGIDIYYSYGNNQYIFDKQNRSWDVKTWSGSISSFDAISVWSDGNNIYYSSGNNHYILDIATSTWTTKTWNGLTTFYGQNIWTDGENIYYSNNYMLDRDTDTWNLISPTKAIGGQYIWTDGDFIYSDNYVYNKTTNSSYRLSNFDSWSNITASNIWTDGEFIYHSLSSVSATSNAKVYKLTKSKNEVFMKGVPNNIPFK